MFEVGRLCLKTAGREAGKFCVIIKKMDDNFVMVTGPKELTSVKRRRCNVNHLEPLVDLLNIKSEASDSEVLKAYQKENLMIKLGFEKKARPGKREAEKERPAEKRVEKPERPRAEKRPDKPARKEKPAKPEKEKRVGRLRAVLKRRRPEKPKKPARKGPGKRARPKPARKGAAKTKKAKK